MLTNLTRNAHVTIFMGQEALDPFIDDLRVVHEAAMAEVAVRQAAAAAAAEVAAAAALVVGSAKKGIEGAEGDTVTRTERREGRHEQEQSRSVHACS